jgi:hypothetical protein
MKRGVTYSAGLIILGGRGACDVKVVDSTRRLPAVANWSNIVTRLITIAPPTAGQNQ